MQNELNANQVVIDTLLNSKEGRIAIAQQSFSFFLKWYMGLEVVDHIEGWIDNLQYNRLHQEAPRDHGKSTIYSLGYAVWKLCKSVIKGDQDENIRILVVSKTGGPSGISTKVKDAIIDELKTNPKILADFGEIITKEKGGNIWVRRTKRGIKDPSLESIGVQGAITGGHYDLIICDDIIDTENSKTSMMREQVLNWFKGTLMELAEPHTQVIVVGTRKHYDDLYQYLLDNKLWNVFIDVAILKYPHNYEILMPDEDGYEQMTPEYAARLGGEMKEINKAKVYVEGEYEVLWPGKWDIFQLLYNKYDIGSIIFNREKQNDPSGMQGRILNTEWIKFYEDSDLPRGLHIYMGVDLAATASDISDYMAICVCGYEPVSNKIYVLEFWRGHKTFVEQVGKIEEFAMKWAPIRITIESNAYQNAMIQYQHAMNMFPVVGSPTVRDKVTRMIALAPYIETGRMLFNKNAPYYGNFEEEYTQFPSGKNDDILDSLDLCVRPIVATGEVSLGTFMNSEIKQAVYGWFDL